MTEVWSDLRYEKADVTGLSAGKHEILQYVISRQENGNPELLRISLEAGEEEALPVFSSERLARWFLRSSDLGSEWHVRESYNGELVSLLLGPCTDVAWVLPNPLPEPLAAEDALLNLLDRRSFVGLLLASGHPHTGDASTGPATAGDGGLGTHPRTF